MGHLTAAYRAVWDYGSSLATEICAVSFAPMVFRSSKCGLIWSQSVLPAEYIRHTAHASTYLEPFTDPNLLGLTESDISDLKSFFDAPKRSIHLVLVFRNVSMQRFDLSPMWVELRFIVETIGSGPLSLWWS